MTDKHRFIFEEEEQAVACEGFLKDLMESKKVGTMIYVQEQPAKSKSQKLSIKDVVENAQNDVEEGLTESDIKTILGGSKPITVQSIC